MKDGKYLRRVSMSDYPYRSVVIGFIVGMTFLTAFYIFTSADTPINESSFEVVDRYKECDVVRYAPHQASTYKYFLYCENNK
jgi:hypothetical protein